MKYKIKEYKSGKCTIYRKGNSWFSRWKEVEWYFEIEHAVRWVTEDMKRIQKRIDDNTLIAVHDHSCVADKVASYKLKLTSRGQQ